MENVISLFSGVVDRFEVKKNTGTTAQVKCPCHDDKKASLTISIGQKGITMKCHAGCDTADILDRVGLSFKDLFYNSTSTKVCRHSDVKKKTIPIISKPPKPEKLDVPKDLEDLYSYVDIATGEYLFTKFRTLKKEWVIGYRTADGQWWKGLPWGKDFSRAVFTRTQKSIFDGGFNGEMICYAEGCKDVKSLAKLGYTAITCGGVGTFKKSIIPYLQGNNIVVFGDNHDIGINDAKRIKKAFLDAGMFAVTVIPPVGNKEDITDFIQNCKADGMTNDEIKLEIDALIVNAIHAAGI